MEQHQHKDGAAGSETKEMKIVEVVIKNITFLHVFLDFSCFVGGVGGLKNWNCISDHHP